MSIYLTFIRLGFYLLVLLIHLVCFSVCFCSFFLFILSSVFVSFLFVISSVSVLCSCLFFSSLISFLSSCFCFLLLLSFDLVCFFVCFCSFFLFVFFHLSFLGLYSVNENDTRHALRLSHMLQTKKTNFNPKVFLFPERPLYSF